MLLRLFTDGTQKISILSVGKIASLLQLYHRIPRADAWNRHSARARSPRSIRRKDRRIRVLAVDIPSVDLLPRRDEYTRVYTTVYPRVHNCIHACTQVRSKYLLCRARLYVYSLGIIRRISRDRLRLPGIWNNIPEDPKAGVCERDHASALIESPLLHLLLSYLL